MKQFIKNSLLITVLMNFGMSLQVHAAKPVDQSAQTAQGRLGRITGQVQPKEQIPAVADESGKRAQERLKRIGGQLKQPKPQSVLSPEDVGATSEFLRPEYCENIKKTWKEELRKYGKTIIKEMLDNEERYKESHFVFYHGQRQENRIVVELLRNLYRVETGKPVRSDFEFLRFWKEGSDYPDVNSYLDSFGIPNPFKVDDPVLSDLDPKIRTVLLSVNPVLFGNFDQSGSCTWAYFLQNFNIENFVESALKVIFSQVKLDQKFIKDLTTIVEQFPTETGDLVQIFIPKNIVDKYAYLSKYYGVPQKQYIFDVDGKFIAENDYDVTRERYVRCSGVLEFLQNAGRRFADTKNMQLRLFFAKTGPLLNPDMGAKIFRFTTLTPAQLQEYKRQVAGVVDNIFGTHPGLLTRMKSAVFGFETGTSKRVLTAQEQDIVARAIEDVTEPDLFEAIALPNALAMIKKLVAKGVNINDVDDSGTTLLTVAVEKGKLDVVEFLAKIPGIVIDARDRYGRTALMYAAKAGNLDMVKNLVAAGANIEIKDPQRTAALDIAKQKNQVKVVEYLQLQRLSRNLFVVIEHPDAMQWLKKFPKELIVPYARDDHGRTPLMAAAQLKKLDVIQFLIDAGVDINARGIAFGREVGGKTALMVVANQGILDSAQLLIKLKADVNAKDDNGETALMYAAASPAETAVEVAKLLVEAGADINAENVRGRTALQLAKAHRRGHVVDYLESLELLSDIFKAIDHPDAMQWIKKFPKEQIVSDRRDSTIPGWTPLIYAVQKNKLDVVQFLVKAGVDIEAISSSSMTALMYAAASGNLAIVKFLVEAGADIDAKDKNGVLAWQYAQAKGHESVVQYLKDVYTKRLSGAKQVIKKIKSKL
ncbi:MAG TPA: ankyrin repeat domain-containing protein [Candidatus Babeliales bacterium]|nr:ankyrin repeat domain-containing protein [Candidatus Babeliales bacterium]